MRGRLQRIVQVAPALLLSLGCSEDDPGAGHEPIAEPLSWTGGAVGFKPEGTDQHHATVALDAEGRTLLAHSGEQRVVLRMLDPALVESWAVLVPGFAHHPQVARRPGGFFVVLNETQGSGPVFGQALDAVGTVGEPVLLTDHADAFYPDLAVVEDRGIAVWAEGTNLGGASFVGIFEELVALVPSVTEGNVDPPSVRAGADSAWAVWTETGLEEAVVRARPIDLDGAWLAEAIEIDRQAGVGSGRPAIAVHPSGRFTVAWRWFGEAGDPDRSTIGAWVRTYDADGAPLTEPSAICDDCDRPVLVRAGSCVLLAWEQGDVGWMQLLDGDGQQIMPAVPIDGPGTVQRLYVDVHEVAGRLDGRVSWEGRDGAADLDLWVRPFTIGAAACTSL